MAVNNEPKEILWFDVEIAGSGQEHSLQGIQDLINEQIQIHRGERYKLLEPTEIKVYATGNYDDGGCLMVSVWRMETPTEAGERAQRDEIWERNKKQKDKNTQYLIEQTERAEYNRLKEKYGDK